MTPIMRWASTQAMLMSIRFCCTVVCRNWDKRWHGHVDANTIFVALLTVETETSVDTAMLMPIRFPQHCSLLILRWASTQLCWCRYDSAAQLSVETEMSVDTAILMPMIPQHYSLSKLKLASTQLCWCCYDSAALLTLETETIIDTAMLIPIRFRSTAHSWNWD